MEVLVLQSDFGMDDGAVSAMKGVAVCVNRELQIYDLTHGIETYNIWEAGFRLVQTMQYWPEGTVFVSVVDPGVGSARKSIVAKTANRYIVTPDNGTLSFVALHYGIDEIREINEASNRLNGSEKSYTFHGRDVYAYTGARLASGAISFEEVGPVMDPKEMIELEIKAPDFFECENGSRGIKGIISVHDVRYGSLWTNIPRKLFAEIGRKIGDRVEVEICNGQRVIYKNTMVYAHSFADVLIGEPLIYINSVDCMAVAINQGSFAKAYNIGTGNEWTIALC